MGEIRIRSHNAKASSYFGKHDLLDYNNLEDCTLEILPNNKYRVYNHHDTIANGKWELSVLDDNSTMLLLNGRVFGIGEYETK